MTGPTLYTILIRLRGILDALIPFIIGLSVFVIVWGIFRYITEASNEEKRAEAKRFVVWGIIGVFFMLSIWGFVAILVNTFEINRTIDPDKDIPKVPVIQTLPTRI